jgi:hypothetical protein
MRNSLFNDSFEIYPRAASVLRPNKQLTTFYSGVWTGSEELEICPKAWRKVFEMLFNSGCLFNTGQFFSVNAEPARARLPKPFQVVRYFRTDRKGRQPPLPGASKSDVLGEDLPSAQKTHDHTRDGDFRHNRKDSQRKGPFGAYRNRSAPVWRQLLFPANV